MAIQPDYGWPYIGHGGGSAGGAKRRTGKFGIAAQCWASSNTGQLSRGIRRASQTASGRGGRI